MCQPVILLTLDCIIQAAEILSGSKGKSAVPFTFYSLKNRRISFFAIMQTEEDSLCLSLTSNEEKERRSYDEQMVRLWNKRNRGSSNRLQTGSPSHVFSDILVSADELWSGTPELMHQP